MTRLAHDWFPRPLPGNVVVDSASWIYSSYAFVHYQSRRPVGLRVGHDSGLYHGTFFDLGPDGQVEIGDYCSIVGAIFSTNGRVTIGDYTFIAHEVVIADRQVAVPVWGERAEVSRPTIIGENVWIGARASLVAGVRVGDGAVIGAAAVVQTDIPPYTVYAGNPAEQVGVVPQEKRT